MGGRTDTRNGRTYINLNELIRKVLAQILNRTWLTKTPLTVQ